MINPTRFLSSAALALSLTMPLSGRAQTPAASPAKPVYVVAFVDFAPSSQEKGRSLLRDYAADACRAPGAQRFEVVQELALPNHFTLLEVWNDEAARQAYEYADRTRQFRAEIQPLIGSPFIERLGQLDRP